MDFICAKLKPNSSLAYRAILSSDNPVFPEFDPNTFSTIPYQCGAILEDGELFFVEGAKTKDFANDLMNQDYITQDFETITRQEFTSGIDFLFVLREDSSFIFFQNISRPKLITKKRLIRMGEKYVYRDDWDEITVHDAPDAIYDKANDRLYFHKLEAVTGIFSGIDQLYREATQEETETFLQSDFITLSNGYAPDKVKTANRKRIALAVETLSKLKKNQRKKMVKYIGEYCPDLKVDENTFEIGSENDLKLLLYGIEQRFYTTEIGKERRLANSVIRLEAGGTK